jgi:uncharacterized protein YaiE (UPF0345 family)
MILASKFDILRGYPREGAIDEVFPVNQTSPPAYDALPSGSVITVNSSGNAVLATTPNRSSTNPVAVWVVIEGNDDFSGTFLEEVTCLKGNAELKLDPSNLNAGAFTVGEYVTFSSGKWSVATTNNQIIGFVLANNVSVDGTVTVMYTGGDTASF